MRRGWLVRLYPEPWRRRYGAEFRALLDDQPASLPLLVDVIRGAFEARRNPTFGAQEISMTSRRLQATSALLAVLLVLPALTFLGSAVLRQMQPLAYEPARHADQVFAWFGSLDASSLILWVAPTLALMFGAAAIASRLREDAALRADLALFGQVGLRLLRRPTLIAGCAAVIGSLAVLAFVVDHAIVG